MSVIEGLSAPYRAKVSGEVSSGVGTSWIRLGFVI